MSTTSYSRLRENLAEVWDRVENTQEPVIVTRRGHQDMAILPAEELQGLRETAYLVRSPRNAKRLLEAIARAVQGEAITMDPPALRASLKLQDDR
jgi:antitoxin YefM